MITAKSLFVEEKYTAQYYSGNGCLYVSGAGGVLKGGIADDFRRIKRNSR